MGLSSAAGDGQIAGMSLASTGITIRRRFRAPPTHVQVFGERSSGTNFVKRTLGRNTALTPVEHYGWKHGFAQMTGIGARALIVGVVREPVGWLRSMYAKPWHCPPEMQALAFPEFIRAEWATVIDRKRYFEGAGERETVGTPLQQDRHPITGRPFANILALRRAKAAWLLGLGQRGCNLVLCRLDAVQADPQGFVTQVCAAFDLEPGADFEPVTRRLGARFLPNVEVRAPLPETLAQEDMAFIRENLDPRLEAAMGFALP